MVAPKSILVAGKEPEWSDHGGFNRVFQGLSEEVAEGRGAIETD